MNKYYVYLDNHLFAGMGQGFGAIANSEDEFSNLLDLWAHDHFSDLGGYDDYDEEDLNTEYTIEELDEAPYATVEEFNPDWHGEWEWLEILYDGSTAEE